MQARVDEHSDGFPRRMRGGTSASRRLFSLVRTPSARLREAWETVHSAREHCCTLQSCNFAVIKILITTSVPRWHTSCFAGGRVPPFSRRSHGQYADPQVRSGHGKVSPQGCRAGGSVDLTVCREASSLLRSAQERASAQPSCAKERGAVWLLLSSNREKFSRRETLDGSPDPAGNAVRTVSSIGRSSAPPDVREEESR